MFKKSDSATKVARTTSSSRSCIDVGKKKAVCVTSHKSRNSKFAFALSFSLSLFSFVVLFVIVSSSTNLFSSFTSLPSIFLVRILCIHFLPLIHRTALFLSSISFIILSSCRSSPYFSSRRASR